MKQVAFLFGCLLAISPCTEALAQASDTLFVVPDSTRAFTLDNLYELILKNHPTAKQANLLSEVARQEIRQARGNFDPKLEVQLSSKKLKGQEYFDALSGSLKFPTLFPVDPSIGIDKNTGAYLNPERYIDNEFNYRQLYAGIGIPLGRGLITDERRTALRQAELFKDMTEAEKLKIINKLLLDAAHDYWDWYAAYYNYRLLNRSVFIARDIFDRVKTNYAFGEAAVVDTVQAKITWQQRLIEQREALVNFRNTGLELSNMLWDSLNNPLSLDLSWVPVLYADPWAMTNDKLKELAEEARANHPDLKKIEVKIYQLEAEKRLAKEFLKPQLNLSYYAINQPINPNGEVSFVLNDNYKVGLDFSFPILLRKERSKLALTNVKITNTKFEQSITERQILNNLSAIYNELINLQAIMASQKEMVDGYQRLLEAELANLEQGESDLFKINVQQEKLIQAQTKWLKLLAHNEKQKAKLYWAAGTSRAAAQ